MKVGDTVHRMLGCELDMPLRVTDITEEHVVCGPWKFRRDTGGEVDEDLDWDGIRRTGSYLQELWKGPTKA
jgi:hypothetical protein